MEYLPLGVVGVICPWNFPFHNIFCPLVPALFALAVVAALSTPAGPRAEAGAAGNRSAGPHARALRTDVIARGAAGFVKSRGC